MNCAPPRVVQISWVREALVVDADSKLLGIITQTDLLAIVGRVQLARLGEHGVRSLRRIERTRERPCKATSDALAAPPLDCSVTINPFSSFLPRAE